MDAIDTTAKTQIYVEAEHCKLKEQIVGAASDVRRSQFFFFKINKEKRESEPKNRAKRVKRDLQIKLKKSYL